MRILVVGDGHSEIHEVPVAESFRKLGHEVEVFFWCEYFRSEGAISRKWVLAQNKFLLGPKFRKINRDFVTQALQFAPDLVFIYRGTHIASASISAIKRAMPSVIIFGYNNDNPFAPGHPPYLWRHFMRSVPLYDVVFCYRSRNIQQLLDIGAKRVKLLRSWFVPWLNHPVEHDASIQNDYACDVVFVGHYEPDNRFHLLEQIERRGWKLKLFGHGYGWNRVLSCSSILHGHAPVRLVWGKDYNLALGGAQIALCFFSKLNQDTYTRRCFEIPAVGTLLLSEYSEDLASLFQEGVDADFFRSEEELLRKIEFYLANEERRKAVAQSGFNRVHNDGHDVVSRMRQVLDIINEL